MTEKDNMIKTPEVLFSIMKASALGDMCFSHMLNFLKVGMTEEGAAREIERFLLALGAEGLAFPTICVSGNRGDLPHGEPSDKVIEFGDFVTLDFGGIVDGYCGDMTRTVVMGQASEKQKMIYDLVLKAQEAALREIKAGVSCKHIDDTARNIIAGGGFEEYFVHGTGHGVGREVHEPPTLNTKSHEILKEGMPVTVEPGIYIPGEMGVRIEDLAIVTKFGIINTVKSKKELIVL